MEADQLNEKLSIARADAIKDAVRKRLQGLNPGIPITFDVERVEGEPPRGLEVGSYGEGSRTTLEEEGGDRSRNDPAGRRVEVRAELVKTRYIEVGKSRAPQSYSARDRFWYLTVTDLVEGGFAIFGGAIELRIENRLSNKAVSNRSPPDTI